MNLLILGGTVFLGRALTDAALGRNHSVTHFNRGKSSAGDPRVETLHGDRTDAASLEAALGARSWDAVIDTSGYMPQVVRLSLAALRGRVKQYLFVSTISVYAGFERDGIDEEAPVSPAPDPLPDTLQMELYGPLKSACEAEVRAAWGERALIVRPGLIVGPHDPTDRFTYWPVRVARGGEVLAPGRPARNVQFIDVRDLAEWMVFLVERGVTGIYNATGPERPLTMAEFLESSRRATGSDARFTWFDDAKLLEAKVGPWREMPLWIPDADPMRGLGSVSIERALAKGLRFRSVEETVRDTLAWARTRPEDHAWKAGLAPEREAEVLGA